MAHQHSVYDTDKHFKIDPITRKIENQSKSKITLIQNDHDSERFTFEIPRYVEEHDMSICNKVEVHYLNIDGETKETNPGVYEVEDLQVSPDSEDVVICSWLISRNATKHIGTLHFALRFACLTDDIVDYDWRTGIYSEFQISKSIFNSEVIVEDYFDVLEQWKQEVLDEAGSGGTIEKVNADWNENDETSPAYIQNRTHWQGDPVETVLLDETELTNFISTSIVIEVGNAYIVTWDGVRHETTAVDSDGMVEIYAEDNSFCLRSPTPGAALVIAGDGGTHTISVSAMKPEIHKIDPGYLPEGATIGAKGQAVCGEIFNSYDGDYGNVATGDFSHAEGRQTTASGAYSHAEGTSTTAAHIGTHAEGMYTETKNEAAHAEGNSTIASGIAQHVQGKYNVEDVDSRYAHIVGNGSSDTRSNAHTLDWDGNGWYAGSLYVGGTSQDDAYEVATKSYVDEKAGGAHPVIHNLILTCRDETYTSNMTYSETCEAFNSGTLVGGLYINYDNEPSTAKTINKLECYDSDSIQYIRISMYGDGDYFELRESGLTYFFGV